MGQVTTTIRLTNWDDERGASQGKLLPHEVRSETLLGVLVDTGATTLCLPAAMIGRLGLEEIKKVEVRTAAGVREVRVMGMVKVDIGDRADVFSCLELADDAEPLLGLLPLESLGLNPNVHTEAIEYLPMKGKGTYFTAYALAGPR